MKCFLAALALVAFAAAQTELYGECAYKAGADVDRIGYGCFAAATCGQCKAINPTKCGWCDALGVCAETENEIYLVGANCKGLCNACQALSGGAGITYTNSTDAALDCTGATTNATSAVCAAGSTCGTNTNCNDCYADTDCGWCYDNTTKSGRCTAKGFATGCASVIKGHFSSNNEIGSQLYNDSCAGAGETKPLDQCDGVNAAQPANCTACLLIPGCAFCRTNGLSVCQNGTYPNVNVPAGTCSSVSALHGYYLAPGSNTSWCSANFSDLPNGESFPALPTTGAGTTSGAPTGNPTSAAVTGSGAAMVAASALLVIVGFLAVFA